MTKYLPQSGGTIALDLGLQVENQWNFTCKVAIDETTTTLEGATLVSDIISFEPGNTSSVQVNIPKFTKTSGNVGIKILEINGKTVSNSTRIHLYWLHLLKIQSDSGHAFQ